jgi:hypothetical protein
LNGQSVVDSKTSERLIDLPAVVATASDTSGHGGQLELVLEDMPVRDHSLLSSYREMVLEHLFSGEVMRHVWLSGIKRLEVLKPQVDDGGYDLVLEACRSLAECKALPQKLASQKLRGNHSVDGREKDIIETADSSRTQRVARQPEQMPSPTPLPLPVQPDRRLRGSRVGRGRATGGAASVERGWQPVIVSSATGQLGRDITAKGQQPTGIEI